MNVNLIRVTNSNSLNSNNESTLPIITLKAKQKGNRDTISFNNAAVRALGLFIPLEKNKVIFFEEYNVGLNVEDYKPVLFGTANSFVNVPVITKGKPKTKKIKSFEVHINNLNAYSKELYSKFTELFNLNNEEDNHILLTDCGDHTNGAYTISLYTTPEFNKGESMEINTTN